MKEHRAGVREGIDCQLRTSIRSAAGWLLSLLGLLRHPLMADAHDICLKPGASWPQAYVQFKAPICVYGIRTTPYHDIAEYWVATRYIYHDSIELKLMPCHCPILRSTSFQVESCGCSCCIRSLSYLSGSARLRRANDSSMAPRNASWCIKKADTWPPETTRNPEPFQYECISRTLRIDT